MSGCEKADKSVKLSGTKEKSKQTLSLSDNIRIYKILDQPLQYVFTV